MAREKDFIDMGKAPSSREQRPYLWAFHDFVRSSKNRSDDGSEWTTPVIIRALWGLWDGSLKTTFNSYRHFHELFYQEVYRIRKERKKGGTQSALLFELIKKFLQKHAVSIPEIDTRKILRIADELPLFVPPQTVTTITLDKSQKVLRETVVVRHIPPHRLSSRNQYLTVVVRHIPPHRLSSRNQYLAIKLSLGNVPSSLAILFSENYSLTYLGLYFGALDECYLRRSLSDDYIRLRFHSQRQTLDVDLWVYRDNFFSEEPELEPEFNKPKLRQGFKALTKSKYSGKADWKLSRDAAANAFAHRFFNELDI